MAIRLNTKIKLTTKEEKLFVEAGGGDVENTLSQEGLATALTNTIGQLADRRSPILIKLYRQYEEIGKVPSLESLSSTNTVES